MACGANDEAVRPDDAVSLEDLQEIDEQLDGLEDRVDALEDGALLDEDPDGEVFADPRSFIGEEVTVTGEVGMVLPTTGSTAAYLVGGDQGEPIPVALDDPAGVGEGDVVTIEGTVVAVDREAFDTDFGVAPDQVFQDPGAFFERTEGDVAISADLVAPAESDAG